jgi:UDP-N-acetylmuramoylalanine--D-glutamate ligase
MKLDGARVVVVGMARSGVAAVELLLEKGASVAAVDQNPLASERLGMEVLPQVDSSFAGADLVVLSPGVPADVDVLKPVRARGVKVIGDVELASWFMQGDTIGITGSNGKTTTTALTGHILKQSGIAAQVGGNIGTPPASMVNSSRPGQWNVLELSSFQLETAETFHVKIGAALNVTPDHLDRHHTREAYAEAKARLFVSQRAGDFAVLNADDPVTRSFAERGRGTPVWFSTTRTVGRGADLFRSPAIAGNLERRLEVLRLEGKPLMDTREIPMRGIHNVENTMAAALIASLAGAGREQIREAVMTFPGVEHRLEFVRELGGVAWYNDSKATNVDATLKAVAAFDGGLWVILGGKDKGSDYTPLAEPLKSKARRALLIGAAAAKIERDLHGVPLMQCETLEHAVEEAHRKAHRGDTVLLAPACASFDQFENFEHRGREFKRLVNALEEGKWRN